MIDWTRMISRREQASADLAARRATMVCSRLQGRLTLGPSVCAVLDAMAADPATPWAMRETIANARDWHRLSQTIDEMGWLLNFTDEAMDGMFEQAMRVEV